MASIGSEENAVQEIGNIFIQIICIHVIFIPQKCAFECDNIISIKLSVNRGNVDNILQSILYKHRRLKFGDIQIVPIIRHLFNHLS